MYKFQRVFWILLLTAFFSACSKDDSGDVTPTRVDRSANLKATGDSAEDLLSDITFTSMNIELVYVNGNKPTDAALASLKNFIETRTFKPDGVSFNIRAVNSSGKAPFDIDEIAAIEREERTSYTVGDEIAIYIYFADGSNEKDKDDKFVLGSAFRNTSMVIYERTIRSFANRVGAPSRAALEAATLNHEFGHLFGLVDLGTPLTSDHEDPDSNGHCNVSGCLMRANLEFGISVVDIVESGVPALQEACISDLQANGGR